MHLFWRSKTFYFFTMALFCCLFFWISWQPLSSSILEWYFKNRVERQLGGSLKIENVHWENDQLVLEGPRLFTKETSGEQKLKFNAKQIIIDYDFSFWQRKWLIKLLIKDSTFSMESTAEILLKAALNAKSKKKNLFSLDWELSIPDGIIAENDQTAAFTLEIASNQNSTGHFSIHFNPCCSNEPLRGQAEINAAFSAKREALNSTTDDAGKVSSISEEASVENKASQQAKNAAVISAYSLKGHIYTEPSGGHSVKLTFEDTPLPNLITCFKSFEGPLKDLEVSSGFINGIATITLEKKRPPELRGELAFDDVNLKHAPLSFEGKIPKAIFKRSSNSLESPKTKLSLPDPFHFTLRNQQYSSQSTAYSMDATVKFLNGIYEVSGYIANAEQDSIHLGFDLTQTFSLQNGWFNAENLSLEKFVAPYIFSGDSFSLRGEADIKGTFNKETLSIESQSKNMSLENQYFLIETAPFKSDSTPNNEIAVIGKHELNFSTGEFAGEFFLKSGSYLEKTSQLLFTEVCGKISEKNGNILANHLLGYCCGLYFTGAIHVERALQKPKNFEVSLTIDSLNGAVSNLKQFLSHFPALESLRFDAIPLQGNISLSKGPHRIIYDSNANTIQVQEKLSGSLSEGKFDCSADDFSLHELACDFTYDQLTKSLDFDNFQGTLFLGEAENAEEYTISGNLHFNDLFNQQAKFDFSLESNDQELLRLAGYTRLQPQTKYQGPLHIYFDRVLSHIMGSSLIDCKLTLAPTFHIDQFNMDFDFSLQQFGTHFKSLAKTKIWKDLGISEDRLALVNKSKGTFNVNLSYNRNLGPFWFNFSGSDLIIGSQPIQKFILRTKKLGNVWSIEQLQLDRLSIAADIVKENRKWLFNFLGIRWGTSFLAGLKGEYLADKRAFTGNVNLLEIDSFKQLVHEYQPLWLSFQAENADFSHGKLLLSDNQEGFSCTGKWQLGSPDSDKPHFSFEGGVTGNNIDISGYKFEFLQTNCSYSFGNIQLRHITLQDPSGLAQIGRVDIIRNEKGLWGLFIQDCEVADWRPSLLRSVERGPALSSNALIVNRLRIDQLQGQLGNPYSLTGRGELYFNNLQQRNSQNPLFAIPAEIIDRIGLDPSILTPTSGTIYFTIGEGKFFPTKFKDVYSDGRLSQFNLASNTLPSYMDFDGNLNLSVRIKQYNLLFKLTELFTFNITGTLDKPQYSIDKKPKKGMSLFRKFKMHN